MSYDTVKTRKSTNRKYLKVQDLRRLRNLFFSSRRVVAGHYAGRHASPQRGHSVEYNDHREYSPGDEFSDIDWKVFGRTDKMFIKLFEHQSDMTVNLLIDGSASMGYPGPNQHRKYDQACLMAAAIAFLTIKQQDRVSLGVAKSGLKTHLRASGSYVHLDHMLHVMETAWPMGPARLSDALQQMIQRTTRKGLLVIFSDLLEDQEEILQGLSAFTHRGNEVIVFHMLHDDELKLPDLADAVFQDSESAQLLRLNVDDVRANYNQRIKQFIASWRKTLQARGIDYNLVPTSQPYNQALEQYLFGRATMA